MEARLTWDDLLIQDITLEQCRQWAAPWAGLLGGEISPIFLNKFGSWFFRRREGHVESLDVLTGAVVKIADSFDAFRSQVNDPAWQQVYLLTEVVYMLHRHGTVPGPGQCYALAPHPAFGAPNPAAGEVIDPRFVTVMDVMVWQSLCSQALGHGG